VIRFWKITDRTGRIFNVAIDGLGFGVTCDERRESVVVLWPKSDDPEHLLLAMVDKIERCP
jgi:hypothetical protein